MMRTVPRPSVIYPTADSFGGTTVWRFNVLVSTSSTPRPRLLLASIVPVDSSGTYQRLSRTAPSDPLPDQSTTSPPLFYTAGAGAGRGAGGARAARRAGGGAAGRRGPGGAAAGGGGG